MLPWQYALAASCGLVIVAAAIRVGSRPARLARAGPSAHGRCWAAWPGRAALLFGLYGLWQFAGSFTVMSTSGALPRARWLWDAERVAATCPARRTCSGSFLPHPLLVQACN